MIKFKKHISIATLALLLLAVWGEFVICFARGYGELWYTVLVVAVVVSALSLAAFFTKCKYLFVISSVLTILGAILLIGFPAYVCYLALICGALSLIGETLLLAIYLKERRA